MRFVGGHCIEMEVRLTLWARFLKRRGRRASTHLKRSMLRRRFRLPFISGCFEVGIAANFLEAKEILKPGARAAVKIVAFWPDAERRCSSFLLNM
jgi:hypothetical protein